MLISLIYFLYPGLNNPFAEFGFKFVNEVREFIVVWFDFFKQRLLHFTSLMFYFCSIISAEILGVNKFGVILPLIIEAIFTGISFFICSRVARIEDTNLGG